MKLRFKLLFGILVAILWRLGGMDNISRAVRLYGASSLIVLSYLLRKRWLSLASLPLLMGAFSLGYGVNSTLMRLFDNELLVRLTCGLAYALAGIALFLGSWKRYLCNVVAITAGTTAIAFTFSNVWLEEGLIGFLIGIMSIL